MIWQNNLSIFQLRIQNFRRKKVKIFLASSVILGEKKLGKVFVRLFVVCISLVAKLNFQAKAGNKFGKTYC